MAEQVKAKRTDAEYVATHVGMFRGTAGQHGQYCWGHKAHKVTLGGRRLGKLKLWHCAECVAAKLKGQTK